VRLIDRELEEAVLQSGSPQGLRSEFSYVTNHWLWVAETFVSLSFSMCKVEMIQYFSHKEIGGSCGK
jgi:hypothetical protein